MKPSKVNLTQAATPAFIRPGRAASGAAADTRRTHLCFLPGLVLATAFSTIGLLLALSMTTASYSYGLDSRSITTSSNAAPLPIPCHSHNDYWRRQPLLSALGAGCTSVEADVWAYGNELYVGHERSVLSTERTFTSVYVDPLARMLRDKSKGTQAVASPLGLYDMDPTQTLVLLVDIKSDLETAWPLMLKMLAPLREQGWLSRVEGQAVFPGPVTVVATGNAHLGAVTVNGPYRDIFLDAPLANLEDGAYERTNSHYASASLGRSIGSIPSGGLQPPQLREVRRHVQMAHDRGLKARYWGLPAWPISLRNHTWDALVGEGVDVLNVDDLESARAAYAHYTGQIVRGQR